MKAIMAVLVLLVCACESPTETTHEQQDTTSICRKWGRGVICYTPPARDSAQVCSKLVAAPSGMLMCVR